MAKETQKAKIERLEKELSNAYNIIQQLKDEISTMRDKADQEFENSGTYKQMAKKIDGLELKIKLKEDSTDHNADMYKHQLKLNSKLMKEIEELKQKEKEYLQHNNIHKLKNERGAGRKARFTKEQIEEIKQYRADGKTIKQIATMFNCSVGLVHKLINE